MKKTNISNFKKTLSKFVTGVTIVCVKKNKKIYGKTVNSFNSLSLDPPLILFSLGNYSTSIKIFLETKYLTVNILSKKQKNISDNFAKKIPEINEYNFIKGKFNTVLIPNCIGHLECKAIDKIKKGDHTIFICKVLNLDYNNKIKPLSYFNSKFL
tara:strand:- start:308 stop:772 length:465 start_codon:yes stop_codon:yes gene_type:complete